MKIPVQEKIAELERRIEALEKRRERETRTVVTRTEHTVDLEPEMSGLWQSFDAIMKKAFGGR